MAPQHHDRLSSTDEAGGNGSNSGASGTTAPTQPAAPRSLAYEDFEMLLPRGTTASSSGETGAAKFAATATGRWRSWWRRLPRGLDRIAPRSRGFERLGDEAGAEQLPADHPGLGRRWCPEEEASWLSHLTFGFVSSLMKLGSRKHLQQDDLWAVSRRDEAERVWQHFQNCLQASGGVVWRAGFRAYGGPFVQAGVIKVFHDLVMFSAPYILEQLLAHLSQPSSRLKGLGLCGAMLGAALVEALSVNYYFYLLYRTSLHVKICMIQMLYRKSLRISGSVLSEMGVGAIANLQSNDAAKLWTLCTYGHVLWNGPFQILIVMGMLVRILSWAPAMAGLMVTVALIPLSALVGKKLATARRNMVKHMDARVKLVSEVITGIKAIKLYAWEEPYLERISALRDEELKAIRYTQLLSMVNSVVFMSGPVFVSLAAFMTYAALGHPLTAAVAFPALALFNLLRFPIIMFPTQIMNLVHARVGLQRIQAFMEAQEMEGVGRDAPAAGASTPASPDSQSRTRHTTAGDVKGHAMNGHATNSAVLRASADADGGADAAAVAIEIKGGSFSWEAGKPAILRRLDLQVLRGQLVMVVGEVGSGKSSLLAALLAEMHKQEGSVRIDGSVAYTAQDPWIQNTTLRRNILMGANFDEDAYANTLVACALGPDLDMLPAGDASEIGEKGINLSGGQKHRVALARAVYARADIYLLDDPLSAVDAHVGSHLFDRCICGALANTTRVLVTHQQQYLPRADVVVVLEQGRIAHVGRYGELVAKGVDLQQFVGAEENEDSEASSEPGADGAAIIGRSQGGKSQGGDGKEELWEARAEEVEAEAQEASNLLAAVASVGSGSSSRSSSRSSASSSRGGPGGAENAPLIELEMSTMSSQQQHQQEQQKASSTGVDGTPAAGPPAATNPQGESQPLQQTTTAQQPEQQQLRRASSDDTPKTNDQNRRSSGGAADEGRLMKESMRHKESEGRLVSKEERAVGSVKRAVYKAYLAAWSPYFILPILLVAGSFTERGFQVVQNYVLSRWTEATNAARLAGVAAGNGTLANGTALLPPPNGTAAGAEGDAGGGGVLALSTTHYYMLLYFVLALVSVGVGCVRAFLLVVGSINSSRKMHRSLLAKVARLPMGFFDSQPTGRLLNRFTKDTETVDVTLSGSVNSALNCFANAALSMVVIVAVSPSMALAAIPLGFLYARVQAVYIATSRELKRLDSLAFSPIFQAFTETLSGLVTIRAFRRQEQFVERNEANIDNSNRAYWPIQLVNRWLSIRLELMGSFIVFTAAVLVAVVLPVDAGLAGLALTSALNLTGIMNWMVRQTTELEVNLNSVERMIEYAPLSEEAPPTIPGHQPPPSWPSAGAIEAQGLVVRYRPELDPVLRGLTFSVAGGEKIGVCGRTGCGKSTLMMALYRIVELSEGRLLIDGVDTASIGLRDLRSRLSLVPQDPVIFSGSVRSNLDPFSQAGSDAEVWEALRRAGVDGFVRDMEGGLDSPIKEGGANLSVGQRQLLCMARALLRRSRILVLDEATSAVDNTTDALIQRTIRTAFFSCTVLTIAHRLHTIIDSDRILVLDAGRVSEYDTPEVLLSRPNSTFRGLVEETQRTAAKARAAVDLDRPPHIVRTDSVPAGLAAAGRSDEQVPSTMQQNGAGRDVPALALAPSMNVLAVGAPIAPAPSDLASSAPPAVVDSPARQIAAPVLRTESVRRDQP